MDTNSVALPVISVLILAAWGLISLARIRQWQHARPQTPAKALTTAVNLAVWTCVFIQILVPFAEPTLLDLHTVVRIREAMLTLVVVMTVFWLIMSFWYWLRQRKTRLAAQATAMRPE